MKVAFVPLILVAACAPRGPVAPDPVIQTPAFDACVEMQDGTFSGDCG
ncbi:MAG: hypothetical protein AAGL89_09845 [Pseudomonadota bacterium]